MKQTALIIKKYLKLSSYYANKFYSIYRKKMMILKLLYIEIEWML